MLFDAPANRLILGTRGRNRWDFGRRAGTVVMTPQDIHDLKVLLSPLHLRTNWFEYVNVKPTFTWDPL
jgi:hypothetical protein